MNYLSLRFLIIVISFSMITPAFANESVHGVMMVVKGDIKVTSAKDKTTDSAKVGKKVFPGDTITAGPDSRAKIVMSDKNILNISPDSKLIIEKYTNNGQDKNVEIKVEYGKIRASVEQKYDGEKSKFNIKTPSAVAGVRGTDFLTGYDRNTKQSQVVTFSGTVAVGQPGPGGSIVNPVFVQPGQMTTSSDGKAPEKPKSMPKEELNKMNQESAADSSSNKKSDDKNQKGNDESKEESKDDKDKKDDSKEDKKEDKDKKDDKDKKEDKDKKDSKEDGKDKKESKDEAKDKKDDKKDSKDDKKDKKDAKNDDNGKNKEGERSPASEKGERGPSMVDSKDLGPELSRDVNMGNGANMNMPRNFDPGVPRLINTPLPNQFINNAIQNQKSRTTIIIQTQ